MDSLKKRFSKIYDKYIDKIYRFIFFKVNSQDIAQDLTSETFLKSWEVFKQNKNPGIKNIQAFLYKTAKNLIIDHYREKGKVQFVSLENNPLIDQEQNLEEKAILNSEVNNIRKAIFNLKEDYQNVIIWRYLDGLSISEISKLLGRSEQATRVLLHRSLESLRQKLNFNQS